MNDTDIRKWIDESHFEINCSICYEPIINAISTECNHNFCRHCITSWRKQQRKNYASTKCPVCRRRAKKFAENKELDSLVEDIMAGASEERRKEWEDLKTKRVALAFAEPNDSDNDTLPLDALDQSRDSDSGPSDSLFDQSTTSEIFARVSDSSSDSSNESLRSYTWSSYSRATDILDNSSTSSASDSENDISSSDSESPGHDSDSESSSSSSNNSNHGERNADAAAQNRSRSPIITSQISLVVSFQSQRNVRPGHSTVQTPTSRTRQFARRGSRSHRH